MNSKRYEAPSRKLTGDIEKKQKKGWIKTAGVHIEHTEMGSNRATLSTGGAPLVMQTFCSVGDDM